MPSPDDGPQLDAQFARETPLTYGTWGRFKRLYKTVEADALANVALFGSLAARIDAAPMISSKIPLPVEMGEDVRGVSSIAVAGRVVYCLVTNARREMKFAGYEFDPENPLHPTLVGSVETFGVSSLLECGPFLSLLSSGRTTGRLSLFDPDATGGPRWRGIIEMGGSVQAVSAFPYIYAVIQDQQTGWSGLRVLDFTDPDQPQIAGELEIKEAQHIACDGPLVAVTFGQTQFLWGRAQGVSGVSFIDASDPRRPRLLSTLSLGPVSAIALRGSLAFIGVDRSSQQDFAGLHIVDVSDPSHPQKLGFFNTTYYAPKAITLHGDFAYLNGLHQIVNISKPDAPTAAERTLSSGASALVVSDNIAYVGTPYRGLELYSIQNPGKPTRIGLPASGATLAYMKRRIRRVLRNFAKTNSNAYVSLAAAVLAEARPNSQNGLDLTRQWVLAEILYGGSGRLTQRRHGRGPLTAASPAPRRKREERAPEAWDQHLDTASALLLTPALPWFVHEAMAKILLANRVPLPSLSAESLAGFLAAPSPLLVHFAVPLAAALLERGEPVAPETAALAYLNANVKWRRTMETALDRQPRYAGDPAWAQAFTVKVLELSHADLKNGLLPRSYAGACEMIARRFPALVPDALVRTLAAAFLTANRPRLTDLVLAVARRVTPSDATGWLQALGPVPDDLREPAVLALAFGLTSHEFALAEASALTLAQDEFVRASGWRLLAASATAPAVFQALWTSLLDSLSATPALQTAMSSPSALSVLARAGFSAQTIADRLRERPFLAGLLSPQTFAVLLPSVPPAVALSLIAAVADDRWPEFRPFLLEYLRSGSGLDAFWNAAPAALDADAEGRLEARLLGDTDAADTLALVDNPELLSIRDPAFDAALARWVRAHESLFTLNSPLLLQAAIHVLPAVRAWGLERAQALGFDLPFALRLLESSLPASADIGSAFFTSLPPGDQAERVYALALCDSPIAGVRALGRTFVSERWDTLPQNDLLRALFENSHPDMQAFVAELLASSPSSAESAGFDGEVLRARHTARRAKEKIKARQSAAPTVDVPTLLALARSRTPRDSEWAWGQLAKLALAGQEIEGFSVSGVSGG